MRQLIVTQYDSNNVAIDIIQEEVPVSPDIIDTQPARASVEMIPTTRPSAQTQPPPPSTLPSDQSNHDVSIDAQTQLPPSTLRSDPSNHDVSVAIAPDNLPSAQTQQPPRSTLPSGPFNHDVSVDRTAIAPDDQQSSMLVGVTFIGIQFQEAVGLVVYHLQSPPKSQSERFFVSAIGAAMTIGFSCTLAGIVCHRACSSVALVFMYAGMICSAGGFLVMIHIILPGLFGWIVMSVAAVVVSMALAFSFAKQIIMVKIRACINCPLYADRTKLTDVALTGNDCTLET